MVWYLQIGTGPLIRVKGMAKALERARALLRKPRHQGQTPYLVTADDRSAAHLGYGIKRILKVGTEP